MTYNIGGLQYENSIVNSIRQILSRFDNRVNFVNINFETAGFSNVGIDLELMVNNNHFNLEIKQNKKAQMGETSIRYNPLTDDAEIVNEEIVDFAAKLFYLNAGLHFRWWRNVVITNKWAMAWVFLYIHQGRAGTKSQMATRINSPFNTSRNSNLPRGWNRLLRSSPPEM